MTPFARTFGQLAIVAILVSGCGSDATNSLSPTGPPVRNPDGGSPSLTLTVEPGNHTSAVGDTARYVAMLRSSADQSPDGYTITWSTANPAIATASSTGAVIAIAPGSTTVIAAALGKRTEVPLVVTGSATGSPTGSEPTFTSGVQTLLWHETFNDAMSDAALYDRYITQNGENGLHVDATAGLNGSRAMRIDWKAKSGCTDDSHFIEGAFPTPAREVVVQYSVRYQPGFVFDWINRGGPCYGNAKKLFFLWATQGSRFDFISENHRLGAGSDYDHPLFAPNAGPEVTPETLGDGNWHRITLRIRQSSTPTATDGSIHGWIDGVRRWAVNNVASNASGGWVLFKMPATFNQGSPVNQSEWMDDLRIWKP